MENDKILNEPEQQEKAPKNKNWTERTYFILDSSGELWKDNVASEKACRDIIRFEGEYDEPYTIGYRVFANKEIVKRAKTILS